MSLVNNISKHVLIKVLEYYESLGVLEMTRITLPGVQPNDPVLTNTFLYQNQENRAVIELLIFNDCFLRNMQKYRYIANIDDDEIFVPQNVSTWSEMIELIENKTPKVRILTKKKSSSFICKLEVIMYTLS